LRGRFDDNVAVTGYMSTLHGNSLLELRANRYAQNHTSAILA